MPRMIPSTTCSAAHQLSHRSLHEQYARRWWYSIHRRLNRRLQLLLKVWRHRSLWYLNLQVSMARAAGGRCVVDRPPMLREVRLGRE